MDKAYLSRREIDKLFFIRKDLENDRMLPPPHIPAVDDEGKFHYWGIRGGELTEIQWGRTIIVEGEYVAKKKVSERDFYFPFIDFMYQRYVREDLNPTIIAIRHDMNNLAASLKQIELFHELSNDKKLNVQRFVITEIEYIFSVCRSMFDLLQLIAKRIWSKIKLTGETLPSKKKDLPDSFADMALKGSRPSTELQCKYQLPYQWADFYVQQAPFFERIRRYRNEIEHYGLTYDIIFVTDKGFAVSPNYIPFSSFGIWKEETFLPGNLAPIKPVLAFVIKETLGSMDRFVDMLSKERVSHPREIAPGYRVFVTGTHIDILARLEDYIENDVWYA